MSHDPFRPPAADLDGARSVPELQPVTVRYELTYLPPGQSIKFFLFSRLGAILAVTALWGAILLGAAFVLGGGDPIGWLLVGGSILMMGPSIVVLVLIRQALRPRFGRPGETTKFELTLASKGVTLVANGRRTTKSWEQFTHYADGAHSLTLVCADGQAWPVVTASLSSEEITAVQTWMQAHLRLDTRVVKTSVSTKSY